MALRPQMISAVGSKEVPLRIRESTRSSCWILRTRKLVHAFFVAGVESCKTHTTKATKAGHKAAVSSYKKVVWSSPDPALMMMLLYVKAFIIAHLLAFSLSDSKDVRVFFDECSEAAPPEDVINATSSSCTVRQCHSFRTTCGKL